MHASKWITNRNVFVLLASTLIAVSCDSDDFDTSPGKVQPVAGLSASEMADFVEGRLLFNKKFNIDQGLGPFFVETSCAGCHVDGGRGPGTVTIFGKIINGEFLNMINEGGPTLQFRSAVTGVEGEKIPAGANVREIRAAPPIFGRGLIEAIPEMTLRALEDEPDLDGDGISGRLNEVDNADIGLPSHPLASVFGLKGQITFIERFVANAFRHDMGMTSSFFGDPQDAFSVELINPAHPNVTDNKKGVDVDDETIKKIADFIRYSDFPPRGEITPSVSRGDSLFNMIGCNRCHVPTLQTGDHPVPALANRGVEIYSDLLLHDMGPGLTDHTTPGFNGVATGQEWRTPPLRGLRVQFPFLHDGRAGSLEEAILLHGGEAEAVRNAFINLNQDSQKDLIQFLNSL